MNVFSGYGRAMSRYGVFAGRATRSEFWYFLLGSAMVNLLAKLLDHALGLTSLFYFVSLLLHLLPSITVFVRRLHDTDRSGWLYLLMLTVIGVIPLLVFACQRGTPGPNRYGPEDSVAVPRPREVEAKVAVELPPTVRPDGTNTIAEIERLSALHKAGALTDAEFGQMKARLLGGVQP